MPSPLLAVAAATAVVLAGTAGTEAAWTDRATIPGASVRTPRVVPPSTVSCSGLRLSWSSVEGATGYVIGAAGLEIAVSGTSYLISDLLSALTSAGIALQPGSVGVTVEAAFGSWRSRPSASIPLSLSLVPLSLTCS